MNVHFQFIDLDHNDALVMYNMYNLDDDHGGSGGGGDAGDDEYDYDNDDGNVVNADYDGNDDEDAHKYDDIGIIQK